MTDVVHDDLLTRIETIPAGAGAADERRRQVDELVEWSRAERAPLERLRARYLARLYEDSDDFRATEALRVVNAALARVPQPEALFAWQGRERRRRAPRRRSRR
jgi:hypothetical protein